jgi:hypothetical protein
MAEANQKLIEYINQLVTLTNEGKIPWYRANPTTFVWTSEKKLQISLQEMSTRVLQAPGIYTVKKSYVFQIQNPQSPRSNVAVDSKEKPEYHSSLARLFETAITSIDARAADLLEDLLGDETKK